MCLIPYRVQRVFVQGFEKELDCYQKVDFGSCSKKSPEPPLACLWRKPEMTKETPVLAVLAKVLTSYTRKPLGPSSEALHL